MPCLREMHRVALGNRTASGTLFLPKDVSPAPLVLFCHGFNGRGSDFFSAADFLAQRGIASFCLDFCGGATSDESGFPTEKMTLFTQKEELATALDHCKTLPRICGDKIFLFGGSQGGLVCVLLAEERARELKGLVLLFPALCIPDDWRKRFEKESDIPESTELWGMRLGRDYFESIRHLHVFEQIGRFDRPVLLLHGDADDIVPLSYSKRAEKAYGKAKLVVFAGEGHGFSEQGNKTMCRLLFGFVNDLCGSAR